MNHMQPDSSLLEETRGSAAACLLVGVVTVGAQAFVGGPWWVNLASSVVGALAGAGAGALLGRLDHFGERLDRVAVVASGLPRRTAMASRRHGFVTGVGAAVASTIVMAVVARFLGDEVWRVIGPVLIVIGAGSWLRSRQIADWQEQHRSEVFSRLDAPRFAWTSQQGLDQLVVVRPVSGLVGDLSPRAVSGPATD